jgi:hypothetical protein
MRLSLGSQLCSLCIGEPGLWQMRQLCMHLNIWSGERAGSTAVFTTKHMSDPTENTASRIWIYEAASARAPRLCSLPSTCLTQQRTQPHAFEYMKRRARGLLGCVHYQAHVWPSREHSLTHWYSFSETFSLISVSLECCLAAEDVNSV